MADATAPRAERSYASGNVVWRATARYFYFEMALLVALVIVTGFGPTADARLFHPASPRPRILYVHTVLFTGWVAVFVAQAALVRWRRLVWHRRIGVAGIVLGALIPPIGTCDRAGDHAIDLALLR